MFDRDRIPLPDLEFAFAPPPARPLFKMREFVRENLHACAPLDHNREKVRIKNSEARARENVIVCNAEPERSSEFPYRAIHTIFNLSFDCVRCHHQVTHAGTVSARSRPSRMRASGSPPAVRTCSASACVCWSSHPATGWNPRTRSHLRMVTRSHACNRFSPNVIASPFPEPSERANNSLDLSRVSRRLARSTAPT